MTRGSRVRPGRPGDPRRLARLYARLPAALDIRFWRRVAGSAGSPLLYLGCGAGRLAIPLARAGAEVVAVDASGPMLEAFARRLEREPAAVRARLRLVRQDVRRLRLGRRFPTAIAPSNLLNGCLTPGDLGALLSAARTHLSQGGSFVCQVFNPYWLAVGATARGTLPPDARDGRPVRVELRSLRYDPWTQRYRGLATYRLPRDATGPAERIDHEFEARAIFPRELAAALEAARLELTALLGGTGRGRPDLAESTHYAVCRAV